MPWVNGRIDRLFTAYCFLYLFNFYPLIQFRDVLATINLLLTKTPTPSSSTNYGRAVGKRIDSHGQTEAITRVKFLVENESQYVRSQSPRNCHDSSLWRMCSDYLFHLSILSVFMSSISIRHREHIFHSRPMDGNRPNSWQERKLLWNSQNTLQSNWGLLW
jgi:hypothetical protein